jgi:hypothetical protein
MTFFKLINRVAQRLFRNEQNQARNWDRIKTWGYAAAVAIFGLALAGLSATGLYTGPLSVSSQVYTVSNAGTSSLSWSVGRDRPWISLSQNGGTLAAGASVELTVLINSLALDLPVTNDLANVTFINVTSQETDTRQVDLHIGLPGVGTAIRQSVLLPNEYEVTLTGVPGTTCVLEDALAVAGPWNPVITNTFTGMTITYEFSIAGTQSRYFRSVSSGQGAEEAMLVLSRVKKVDNSIVRVLGDTNGVYLIEGSNNTVYWVPVYTNKVPASGEFLFTNKVFAVTDNTEYRAVPVSGLALPKLRHILIVGESLAIGFDGLPPLSVTPYRNNYRFGSSVSGTFLVPLIEPSFETIASGAANQVSFLESSEDILMSNIGTNGGIYDLQKKGTGLYELGLAQFGNAPQAVTYELYRYLPGAIFVVGGEGDIVNPNFGPNIRQWQADYEKDIQFLTGSTATIPMFHSQVSSWTDPFFQSLETASGPFDLLTESEDNPTKTILVCPRYFLPYGGPGALFPGLHLSNEGYRWLGEYYGKAFKRLVVDGAPWTPLKPAGIVRSGTTITAVFDVLAPPLMLDTTMVTNPGNFGFEFSDGSPTPPAIVSVTITGPDTVEIVLSAEPTGAVERLRYAYRGIPGNPGGPTTGPRGNLRDSDNTPSLYGYSLYNWCVHFDKPVN